MTRYMDKYKEDVDSIVETNVNHAMHSTLMSDNQEFFKKHQKRVARRTPQNAYVSPTFRLYRLLKITNSCLYSRLEAGSPFGHGVGATYK